MSREAPTPSDKTIAVRQLAVGLMAHHGLVGWSFRFNRAKLRAGACYHPNENRPGRIELSASFCELNSDAEILDTILHEIAHALVGPGHGHDEEWKKKAGAVGAKPARCGGPGVLVCTGAWRAICPFCTITFDRYKKPRQVSYWCKKCGPKNGILEFLKLN